MKTAIMETLRRIRNKLLNFARVKLLLKVSWGRIALSTLRSPPSFVSEYYDYCVNGILGAIDGNRDARLAVFLTTQSFQFGGKTKTVMINTEHTLVRKDGRDSAGSILGAVPVVGTSQKETYLVRIPGGEQNLSTADQIIEYSIPNKMNVLWSDHKHLYSQKSHYIAPFLSPVMLNASPQGRDLRKIFSLMSLPAGGDRRSRILVELKNDGLDVENISGLVGDTSERMSRIGILINLHQTEHHHTLEELRVLPALLQGVVIVSEPSPLTDQIPYSKFVKFASIAEMPGVLSGLLDNYEKHWKDTFATGEFNQVVSDLSKSNEKAFAQIVKGLGF